MELIKGKIKSLKIKIELKAKIKENMNTKGIIILFPLVGFFLYA